MFFFWEYFYFKIKHLCIILYSQDVAEKCKSLGYNALHIKIRATGGNKTKTPGPGGQSALRALARAGMKIGRIEVSKNLILLSKIMIFLVWFIFWEFLILCYFFDILYEE